MGNLTTHGKSGTRTHRIWKSMVSRCHIQTATGFKNYGARGVTVCDEWRYSFEAFLADMGECPSGQSIERIKNELGYSFSNCRWATRSEQARNKRNNVWFTVNGETLCLADWASRINISPAGIKRRIKAGWDEVAAVTEPPDQPRKRNAKTITANGFTKTIAEWAETLGMAKRSLMLRIETGWSEVEAVTIPVGGKRK